MDNEQSSGDSEGSGTDDDVDQIKEKVTYKDKGKMNERESVCRVYLV